MATSIPSKRVRKRSHRSVSRRIALLRRFRAQSRSSWRRLWFWAIILIAALGAEIYLTAQKLDEHPDYRFADIAAIAIVVFAALMLIAVIRSKLRCPGCRAPIANPYGGHALASIVCSNCGARLGADAATVTPQELAQRRPE